jgi:hypothetical protein
MPRKKPGEITIYQLKATLRHSDPPIWRSFELRGDTPLDSLHYILQALFDWDGDHLHCFLARKIEYGDTEYLEGAEEEMDVTLAEIAPAKRSKFMYEYDFGDSWQVDLVVTDRFPADPDGTYPRLIDGERAAPPDDVGGIWMYEQLAEIMRQPGGLEAAVAAEGEESGLELYLDWFPEGYDPDAFDREAVNADLSRMQPQ